MTASQAPGEPAAPGDPPVGEGVAAVGEGVGEAGRGEGLLVAVGVRVVLVLAVGLGLAWVTVMLRATSTQPSSGSSTSPVTPTVPLIRLFGNRSFSVTSAGSKEVLPVKDTTTVSLALKTQGPAPEKEFRRKASDPGDAFRNNGASPAGVDSPVTAGEGVAPGEAPSSGDAVGDLPPGLGDWVALAD